MSADDRGQRIGGEGLADVLRATAVRVSDKTFLRFADSGDTTFGAFDAMVDSFAAGFAERGVGHGDVVSLMLPNCLEFVACWLGLSRLGAVAAAVNVELRGPGLAHVLQVAGSRMLVVDEEYVEPVRAAAPDLTTLNSIAVRGAAVRARRAFPSADVEAVADLPAPGTPAAAPVAGGDLLMLLFTSGTSGLSKACAISHRYAIRQGELFSHHFGLRAHDTYYCPFPLFHGDATMYTVVPAILQGATAALGRRFSVSRFWDEIRGFEATTFDFMGATLALLLKQPETPMDRDHRVRLGYGIPLPDFAPAFTKRFGVRLATAYGLTETGVVAFQPADEPLPPGAAGKPVWPYEVKIVREQSEPAAIGEVGEILVRSHEPHVVAEGYYGMPEESAATFGDWVRTGDLGRLDDAGFLYFEGRKKDALRRRGQNISAFEIEQILDAFPAVLESAVCGVASDLTEQDVMAFVVPRSDVDVDPSELIAFCRDRMAAYMVPRYVQVVDSLPKTPTEKVAKAELARIGVTATTWDRDAQHA